MFTGVHIGAEGSVVDGRISKSSRPSRLSFSSTSSAAVCTDITQDPLDLSLTLRDRGRGGEPLYEMDRSHVDYCASSEAVG